MGSWLSDFQHGGAFPASQMGYRGTGKWIGFRGLCLIVLNEDRLEDVEH
ncbi:hypothetical protein RHECNPAF_17008 [Rhizobium etli CNPAF512]|jgi:hypothetical protein|nr:hypothetical protein RHECNPAF_17008 [Rhizobium etli CNPAF512]